MKPHIFKKSDFKPFEVNRFWALIEKKGEDECWNWLGVKRQDGYGSWFWRYRAIKPHRVAFTLVRGPIPEGLTIDHLCLNKLCCNPKHLEPVTQSVNILRHITRTWKPFCVNGHDKPYKGTCKICNGIRQKEWRLKNPDRTKEIVRASYDRIGRATRKARYWKLKQEAEGA